MRDCQEPRRTRPAGVVPADPAAVAGSGRPAELAADEAVRAADTVLFTVPNQLGVAYNARILATIAREIAPALGWAPSGAATAA